MKKNNVRGSVLWITRTAVLTAMLLATQFVTARFGNQYLTGSLVNMLLAISAMTAGMASGLTVAAVSPVCAWMLSFGPMVPPLIPFQMLGNMTIVLVWRLMGNLPKRHKMFYVITPAAAAIAKFCALYAGVVLIAVPYLFNLGETQAKAISLMFSYPQLITASVGSAAAMAVITPLQNALKPRNE